MTRYDEIRARAEKATREPWTAGHEKFGSGVSAGRTRFGPHFVANCVRPDDAEFIAHARVDVPWLLDRIAQLRKLCAESEWVILATDDPDTTNPVKAVAVVDVLRAIGDDDG